MGQPASPAVQQGYRIRRDQVACLQRFWRWRCADLAQGGFERQGRPGDGSSSSDLEACRHNLFSHEGSGRNFGHVGGERRVQEESDESFEVGRVEGAVERFWS